MIARQEFTIGAWIMNKDLIKILFNQQYEGGRAFTPVVREDGEPFLASLIIKGCRRFGRIDLSHEQDPNRFLNVVLIRDASEKLLAYLVCSQSTRPSDITDHLMGYILDEDYGMIVAADDEYNIKSVFFVDIYSKGAAPLIPVYTEYKDLDRIVDILVHSGCVFTDYPYPVGSKPNLTVIRRFLTVENNS